MLTARELMRGDAITLTPDMLVEDAVKTLLRKRISGAPVVADRQVVGMFSERDALTALAAASYESEPSGTVGMHMRREPISISPATDMFAIAAEFTRNPVRRLIVVDSDGRMLGVVMRGDLLRALVERPPSEAHPPRTALERATERLRDP